MSGKVVARDLCGHTLVDNALNTILMEERFPAEIVNKQPKVDDKRTKEVLLLDSELTPLQNTESEKVNKNTLNEEHFEELSKIFDSHY